MKHKRRSRQLPPKPRKEATENPISQPSGPSENSVRHERTRSASPGAVFWMMPGLSGFACLIYQILWMRQVSLLFADGRRDRRDLGIARCQPLLQSVQIGLVAAALGQLDIGHR